MKNAYMRSSFLQRSPLFIFGIFLVLSPIALFIAVSSIQREEKYMSQLLLEKGAALIRSFEAGTRAGMMHMGWGKSQIQNLLEETAHLQDIIYLALTDDEGIIIAHNDPTKIGSRLPDWPIPPEALNARTIQHRIVKLGDGQSAYEVYRVFTPSQGPEPGRFGHGGMMMGPEAIPRGQMMEQPWPGRRRFGEERDHSEYIFIGLDIKPLDDARKDAIRHAVIMAAVVLLVGFAGVVSLLLAQNYRVTRQSLARVQAFSDQVVEKMPLGLIALDERGKVASFNEAAQVSLGMKEEKLIGLSGSEVLPQDLKVILKRIQTRRSIIEEDFDIALPGAEGFIPLRISGSVLEDDNGEALGQVMIFKDMTDIRRLEHEVERSRRLASVGSLAAGVAHEIRNPLSSIKGFATYFKERFKDRDKEREIAQIMVDEVGRLDRVIGQLLEFARPSALHLEPTSLGELIKHSLRLIEGDASRKDVSIRTVLPEQTPTVSLDADRLNQALLNLYLNALQAMESGGKLLVSVNADHTAHRVFIAVNDNGCGIAPENKERIFDPYYTTKPGGTGLGLAIVHKIVEAHGGTVTIESIPGQGTTVTIAIPTPNDSEEAHGGQ